MLSEQHNSQIVLNKTCNPTNVQSNVDVTCYDDIQAKNIFIYSIPGEIGTRSDQNWSSPCSNPTPPPTTFDYVQKETSGLLTAGA